MEDAAVCHLLLYEGELSGTDIQDRLHWSMSKMFSVIFRLEDAGKITKRFVERPGGGRRQALWRIREHDNGYVEPTTDSASQPWWRG
jgi:DNA-binding MarR family transcriptional regulator